ncbi:hypothetical protein GCM10011403_25410 [Pseudohongiella nitratireducens]|uniref:EF-hand domain-containing protein n=1 Tax=Pseudohongiella nitratireducens TaxID=1768907 RepID=A0A916VJF8_9GAMM|nr:hypothetical protein [Pseudohongiella nitratireducens]MDF1624075.1 hypothetical protein [Pseudohongiella nitratireducens]GFZ81153.1 hypothetical protein GCM10011403_25410 [Pseudohongiella nitratireducens]|tara:strand:+ start:2415 stop:2831 length:417 start_codon:yes stop_codon:yes gene_type:complete
MTDLISLKRLFIATAVIAAMVPALAVAADGEEGGEGRHGPRPERIDFSELDANGDGSLDFDEFMTLPTPRLDRMDTNGDGNVTAEEMQEQLFLRLDQDGDQLLSEDELRPPRRDREGRGRRLSDDQRERIMERRSQGQ